MNAIVFPFAASFLVFAAVMVMSVATVQHQRQVSTRRSLALVLRVGSIRPADEALTEAPRESLIGSAVRAFSGLLVGPGQRERLRRHLAWAGKPTAEALSTVIDRKLIYLTVGLCIGLMAGLLYGGWLWLLVPAVAVIGYLIPDLVVYNEALSRTEEITLGLPDALDMLDLCVESGLSLQGALDRVAAIQTGPVASEFGRVLHEMRLGVSRADAFAALATRTKQQDLQRFVGAMLQVDKLGIPVASVLKEQSLDMRAKRHSRAREQAQKVPIKILGPLMVCFLPCLFLVILGPAIITGTKVFLHW